MKYLCKNLLLTLLVAALAAAVFGCDHARAVSAEYAQSYSSDKNLAFGTLVSLVSDGKTRVEPTTIANVQNYLGVYVADQSVTLAVDKLDGEKQIAVSGNTIALVSSVAGEIKEGDMLGASVVAGVASRASDNVSLVGVAQSDFSESSSKNSKIQITLGDGTKKEVVIGPLAIKIFASKNGASSKPVIIGWIEQASGKQVSTFKLVVILVVAVLLIGSVTTMAYAAIRTTIVQSSRNPLARPVIVHTLLRIVIIIAAIAFAGVVVVYAVLKA